MVAVRSANVILILNTILAGPHSQFPPKPSYHEQMSFKVNNPTPVTRSRFEITQDGQTSYLEFETDGEGWLTLWHTEVPEQLRGRGLALELVTTAFRYAKDQNLKVDVLCPVAKHILETHPEFQLLVHKK